MFTIILASYYSEFMKDKVIQCIDCQQKFPWVVEEQEFYQEKGLKPPTRCPICRAAFKEAKKDKFRGRIKISNYSKKIPISQ